MADQAPYTSPTAGEFAPHTSAESLHGDFQKVVDNTIEVPEPIITAPETDEPLYRVPMREAEGIYLNMHPQSLTITTATAQRIESLMADWFSHYPYEPSAARQQFGQPMLLTRFDGIIHPDGTIGLCEFDDVPTGFNALGIYNPVAASHLESVTSAVNGTIGSVFLPEEGYVYPHDDDAWLPSVDKDSSDTTNPVIPRARRIADGFDSFINRWGEQSVVAAWERDHKGPLVAMNLGALAANVSVALEMANKIKSQVPVFVKALHSSRTEAAAVIASDKWKIFGKLSANQALEKFRRAGIEPNADEPIVVQHFYRPPSMADLGLKLREHDVTTLAGFSSEHRNEAEAEFAKPGNEFMYHVLSRIYGVYTPELGHKLIGGFWMARPNNAAIIHGASDAISGPLHIEGLGRYTSQNEANETQANT